MNTLLKSFRNKNIELIQKTYALAKSKELLVSGEVCEPEPLILALGRWRLGRTPEWRSGGWQHTADSK